MTEKLYEAIKESFSMFGLEVTSPMHYENSYHTIESPITIMVGLTGAKKGTITIEVDEPSFNTITAAMMPGMDANFDMKLSALSELTNMLSGMFVTKAGIQGLDITPPTAIVGENIRAIISNIDTGYVSCSIGDASLIAGISFV